MRSPNTGVELRQLAGNAESIWARGDEWVSLGTEMEHTASELTAIGNSSVHKSKGTDKLIELATETAGDLSAAAIRYRDTGKALRTYGTALDIAQSWLRSHIDDVERAQRDFENAQRDHEDALNAQRSLESVTLWEDEPTQSQVDAAAASVASSSGALTSATQSRTEMWSAFDDVFSDWSDAYDDAVDAIEKAYETAGNNDGFWEFVNATLDVLAIVLIVLTVIALAIGAPFAGLLTAVIFALSVAVLAMNVLKFAYGRASLSDVAMAAIALIPFGVGRYLLRGVPTLGSVVQAGRGAAVSAIRGGLPSAAHLLGGWLPVVRPLRALSNAWTWLRAPAVVRAGLPSPGVFVNPLNSLRLGGPKVAQVETFVQRMLNSPWAANPGVQQVISSTVSALPSYGLQVVNSVTWNVFFAVGIAGAADLEFPVLSDISLR